MYAIAHGWCMDAVGDSALKFDSERKMACRTGESNLRHRRAGPTLYQLSYIPTHSLTPVSIHPLPTGSDMRHEQ